MLCWRLKEQLHRKLLRKLRGVMGFLREGLQPESRRYQVRRGVSGYDSMALALRDHMAMLAAHGVHQAVLIVLISSSKLMFVGARPGQACSRLQAGRGCKRYNTVHPGAIAGMPHGPK